VKVVKFQFILIIITIIFSFKQLASFSRIFRILIRSLL
jgi:hypothetical protein